MRAGLAWFLQNTDDLLIQRVIDRLATGILAQRHPRTGRFTMLASTPGHEGDVREASNEAIVDEFRRSGSVTFQYWIRESSDNDVMISIISSGFREGACTVGVDFDGLSADQALHLTNEILRLSLESEYKSTSIGLAVDAYLDDEVERWARFCYQDGPTPVEIPYLAWRRVGMQHAIELVAKESTWLFGTGNRS